MTVFPRTFFAFPRMESRWICPAISISMPLLVLFLPPSRIFFVFPISSNPCFLWIHSNCLNIIISSKPSSNALFSSWFSHLIFSYCTYILLWMTKLIYFCISPDIHILFHAVVFLSRKSVLIFIPPRNHLLILKAQILKSFPIPPWAEVNHFSFVLSQLVYILLVSRITAS